MSRRRADNPVANAKAEGAVVAGAGDAGGWDGVYLGDLRAPVGKLVLRGKRRAHQSGVLLINEGDVGTSLFVALRGRFKVFSINSDGNEITYGILERGALFGEMSLDGGPRSASVLALDPGECSVLEREEVEAHVIENPGFALDLVNIVIHRAREATRVARGLALDSAYQRLVQFLELHTTTPTPSGPPVLRHFRQTEIASRIGTSRETVTRLLKDLEKTGFIHVDRFTLTVLRPLPRTPPRAEKLPAVAGKHA